MLTRREFASRAAAVALAAGAAPFALEADPAEARRPRGYRLVWRDEFHRDGRPDPRNWTYEHGFVRNKELQWYQPQNAFCRGGRLVIEARRQRVPNPRYKAGSGDWKTSRQFAEYTSSSLSTQGRHAWKYGYFEMRGRIDTQPGMWPAWWTLGTAKPWPGCGEIDIMEYYAGHVNANVAWQNSNGSAHWKSVFTPLAHFHDRRWSRRFHRWGMLWTESFVELSLDGHVLNHVKTAHVDERHYGDYNPFHHPAFMILNLAIGSAGGDPSHTRFPRRFEVDYVRVYQRR